MGPVLIWPNITIVVNAVFQEILTLTRVGTIKQEEDNCAEKCNN